MCQVEKRRKYKVQSTKYKVQKETIMSTTTVPTFFGDTSDFMNKEDLAQSGKAFCVSEVKDTDTKYGKKWYITILVEGEEDVKTITFSHGDAAKSQREKDFLALSQHPEYLPQHACVLKKYSFEGKTGFRLAHRSGGGACPCTPEVEDIDPFSPGFDELPAL
jgi:hypothetical protein